MALDLHSVIVKLLVDTLILFSLLSFCLWLCKKSGENKKEKRKEKKLGSDSTFIL